MIDRLTGSFRPFLLLIVLALILFLPGIAAVPPIDRDESRFAQASHQMLESGDYIRIKFQEESRAKKPAGIYWLQAETAAAFHAERAIWAYRLPSVLGALLAVLLTFHFGQSLVGQLGALVGAALLASSFILVSEAHQAKTDAVLLACCVAAQGALARLYLAGDPRKTDWPGVLCFWLAQALGILIKGPIVPLISLLTLGSLAIADRRIGWLRSLRPLIGLCIVAVVVGPWMVAVSAATQGQFIGQAVRSDLLPKLLGAQESHGAPPGYFLLLVTATLWPASLFAVPAFVGAIGKRTTPAVRFCLAWIIPAWVLFEVVPTKLPHYVLPTFPALALLAGAAVTSGAGPSRGVLTKLFHGVWAMVGIAVAVIVAAAPFYLGEGFTWLSIPIAAAALVTVVLSATLAIRGRAQSAAVAAILGAALTYGGVYQEILPRLDRLWLSQRIVAMVPPGAPIAAAGYHEPSLVFLLGTTTKLTDGGGAARFLIDMPHAAAVVEAAAEPDFAAALAAAGGVARLIGSVEGINYSRGRPATLRLWTLDTPPTGMKR